MPAEQDSRLVVQEWVAKAEEDWEVASRLLHPAENCPAASVAFHAQQCVEKYLKALLVWRHRAFPKTHDLGALRKLLPAGLDLGLSEGEQDRLTDYATVSRYPGAEPPPSFADAKSAVATARRVRARARKLLGLTPRQPPNSNPQTLA